MKISANNFHKNHGKYIDLSLVPRPEEYRKPVKKRKPKDRNGWQALIKEVR